MTTLYDVYSGTFVRGLESLATVLDAAAAHAAAHGLDPDAFVTGALIADMKPLAFQVQTASNTAKLAVKRIGGPDPGAWADDETTLAALQARVHKTLALVRSLPADALAGKDDELVLRPIDKETVPFREYLFSFAVPNFFFHLQTAYAILRMRGVPLGKRVFLKGFLQE